MDNATTILTLKHIVSELKKRMNETSLLDDDLSSVLFHERARVRNQVAQRVSSLNMRILHLGTVIDDLELRESLAEQVTPLSENNKKKLIDALSRVSQEIAATNSVKAGIKLASDISIAASEAADATEV